MYSLHLLACNGPAPCNSLNSTSSLKIFSHCSAWLPACTLPSGYGLANLADNQPSASTPFDPQDLLLPLQADVLHAVDSAQPFSNMNINDTSCKSVHMLKSHFAAAIHEGPQHDPVQELMPRDMLKGMGRASTHLDGVVAAPRRQECPQADRQYASDGHQQQRPLLQGPQHAPVREAPPCSARQAAPQSGQSRHHTVSG